MKIFFCSVEIQSYHANHSDQQDINCHRSRKLVPCTATLWQFSISHPSGSQRFGIARDTFCRNDRQTKVFRFFSLRNHFGPQILDQASHHEDRGRSCERCKSRTASNETNFLKASHFEWQRPTHPPPVKRSLLGRSKDAF